MTYMSNYAQFYESKISYYIGLQPYYRVVVARDLDFDAASKLRDEDAKPLRLRAEGGCYEVEFAALVAQPYEEFRAVEASAVAKVVDFAATEYGAYCQSESFAVTLEHILVGLFEGTDACPIEYTGAAVVAFGGAFACFLTEIYHHRGGIEKRCNGK